MSVPDAIDRIADALDRGLAGDSDGALLMLQPIVDCGPRETAALLSALAQTAAYTAMRNRAPDVTFGIELTRADGTEAEPEEAPPALLFAARFVTAWANQDRETAWSLFNAMWRRDATDGTNHLGTAVGLVFDMAVVTARELVDEENRQEQATRRKPGSASRRPMTPRRSQR